MGIRMNMTFSFKVFPLSKGSNAYILKDRLANYRNAPWKYSLKYLKTYNKVMKQGSHSTETAPMP